jgi:glyoxylase-like metal-dependent hydrolase (beta-lactamase superfamily II)
VFDDLLAIRAAIVTFYVLKDDSGLYLIDTGFVNGPRFLRRELKRRGWDHLPLRGILLTHGHLDHALNAVPFARKYGAWIAGPRADADHYLGRWRYTGLARVTAFLEGVGGAMLRYQPFTPDRMLDPDEELPIWGGLRAVHVPGHTAGHTAYYSPSRKVLFSADLFNSLPVLSVPPPDIFNSYPEQIPAAIDTALQLDLVGLLPNHCDAAGTPAVHLDRLRRVRARLRRRDQPSGRAGLPVVGNR